VAEIVVEGSKTQSGITKNVSDTGLLVLTWTRMPEGKPVKLTIRIPGDPVRSVEVTGTIVRQDPLNGDEIRTWSEKAAVQFDEPQPALAAEFAELAERQARILGRSSRPPPDDAN
jgi:hypothetical protein